MAAYEPYPTAYSRLNGYPKSTTIDEYGISGISGSTASADNIVSGKLMLPYSLNSLPGSTSISNCVPSLPVPPLLHSSAMGLPSSVPSSLLHPAMSYQSWSFVLLYYIIF